MGGNTCPNCRGELIDDVTYNRWTITLVTPDSVASGRNPDELSIDITMTSGSHRQALASNSGSSRGGYTTYVWTISRPGTPVSGVIYMQHSSLGTLEQDLQI